MNIKSGWRTTEFYITLGAQVIAILVLLGYLSSGETAGANATWGRAVEGAAALIGAGLSAWKYIESRGIIKATGSDE